MVSSEPELYANTLGVLGSRRLKAEQYAPAAETAWLAIQEYRNLAAQDEERYATALAAVFDTLAKALRAVGDETGAAKASTESRTIFGKALREYP